MSCTVLSFLHVSAVARMECRPFTWQPATAKWTAANSSFPKVLLTTLLRHTCSHLVVAVRITERASQRTDVKPISNLIGPRNKQTTTLTFIYSDRLRSYIIYSSLEAHWRT